MKYSLDLNILCNDQATLDRVAAVLPAQTDSRVWPDQYEPPVQSVAFDGVTKKLTASIRFHNIADRDDVDTIVTQLQGLLNLCEVGTWIRLLICNHGPATELKDCEVEAIYEVMP